MIEITDDHCSDEPNENQINSNQDISLSEKNENSKLQQDSIDQSFVIELDDSNFENGILISSYNDE